MPARKPPAEIFIRQLDPSPLATIRDVIQKDGKIVGAVYGQRLPTSWVVRDAIEGVSSYSPKNPSPTYGNSTSGALVDPYNNASKNRFEDTFRADKVAQRALLKKVTFILSNKPSVTLDVNEEYPTEELYKQALESIMTQQEFQKLLVDIKKINKTVRFYNHLITAEVQKRVFGRAALGVVLNSGLPTDLKPFSSKNLGKVYVDNDWKFTGVDYHDNLVAKQTFNASELIYLTHLDFNITPNTLFYGLSEFEGIAHDSETNRIVSEEDNKEAAKGQWAGVGVIKAPSITSDAQMTTLVNAMDPGKWNAINADVTMEVHALDPKIDQLTNLREANDKRIIRGIDVPQPTMGYEDVTNRATMDTVMQVYHATTLDFERQMLKAQIEPQWYDTLTMKLLNIPDMAEAKARVVCEFEDLVFETFQDKATPILSLLDRGLITPQRALKMMGLDDAIAEMEEAESLQMEKQKEQMDMEVEAQPQKKAFE